jgi:hypothetical protein
MYLRMHPFPPERQCHVQHQHRATHKKSCGGAIGFLYISRRPKHRMAPLNHPVLPSILKKISNSHGDCTVTSGLDDLNHKYTDSSLDFKPSGISSQERHIITIASSNALTFKTGRLPICSQSITGTSASASEKPFNMSAA